MAQADPFLGIIIGDRYRLTKKLGEGGFGFVYAAEHVKLGSFFAIKLLRRNIEANPQLAKRFEREARVTANLSHPGIVRVTDYGHDPVAGTYLVMEHLKGCDLSDRIKRDGPFAPTDALPIFLAIVDAFAYAHRAGIVHRDVKTANVFLVDDEHAASPVKVLDFGIAHLISDDFQSEDRLTQAGTVLGSVHYMSPEQALGARVDRRSDLYSLGVVLFEMLTGGVPFRGASPLEVLSLHVKEVPKAPSITRADRSIPLALDGVVLRCMQKQAKERYQSAEELATEIGEVQRSLASGVQGVSGTDTTIQQLRDSMQQDASRLADASSAEARRIVSGSSDPGTPTTEASPVDALAKSTRWRVPLVAGVVLALLALGGWLTLRGDSARPALTAASSPPDSSSPSTPPKGVPVVVPVPAPAPIPAPEPRPVQEPPAPPPPMPVTIVITSDPSGADVRWADHPARLGKTPFPLELKPEDDKHVLLFSLAGYRDKEVTVDLRTAKDDGSLTSALTRVQPQPTREALRPAPTPSNKKGIDDL